MLAVCSMKAESRKGSFFSDFDCISDAGDFESVMLSGDTTTKIWAYSHHACFFLQKWAKLRRETRSAVGRAQVSTMISKRYKNEPMTHGCVCTEMMKAMMKKMSSLTCRSTPKVDTLGPQQQALGLDQMTHLTDFRLIRLI